MKRKADEAFLSFSEKVFKRDHDTCQYCGFTAKEKMDVVNLDGNYLNNKLSNLVTSCPFCTQCQFLDAVGTGDFGGGALIYFPEMSQTELNALIHVLFACIAFGNSFNSRAKDIYRSLKSRTEVIEKTLGEGLSSPSVYGQMLIDSGIKVKDMHSDLVDNLRLLPNLKCFAPYSVQCACAAIRTLS